METKIINGNLRVEGWLEAPNIKGILKGMFPSADNLRGAYPRPITGWAALVGKNLPAEVYVASEGRWQATGGKGGSMELSQAGLGPVIEEEASRREEADKQFESALSEICGYRKISPQWALQSYISTDNKLIEGEAATGFRRSAWIRLKAGETIVVRLNTAGKTFPIALEAADQPVGFWDFPPLGEDLSSGLRQYRYTSDHGDRVMVSSYGTPEAIYIYRDPSCKIRTRLTALNGTVISSTRKEFNSGLDVEGNIIARSNSGVCSGVKVVSAEFVELQTYIEAGEDESAAFANFYDENGNLLEVHYAGVRLPGSRTWINFEAEGDEDSGISLHSDATKFYHESGIKEIRISVPARAFTANFAYHFPTPRKMANPVFRVRLC